MRIRQLGKKEIVFIACSLARRITGFHAKGLVLGQLLVKDVYVKNRLKRVKISTFLLFQKTTVHVIPDYILCKYDHLNLLLS